MPLLRAVPVILSAGERTTLKKRIRGAKTAYRDRLRARVHLLGVAEHGGHLLDHLEVDVKHNETSHFTELLEPVDLADAVVTFDALHTVRANLDWLVTDKKEGRRDHTTPAETLHLHHLD